MYSLTATIGFSTLDPSRLSLLNSSASTGFFSKIAAARRMQEAGAWPRTAFLQPVEGFAGVRVKKNKGHRARRDSPYLCYVIRGLGLFKARAIGMNYGFFKGLMPPSFEPFFTELFFVIFLFLPRSLDDGPKRRLRPGRGPRL